MSSYSNQVAPNLLARDFPAFPEVVSQPDRDLDSARLVLPGSRLGCVFTLHRKLDNGSTSSRNVGRSRAVDGTGSAQVPGQPVASLRPRQPVHPPRLSNGARVVSHSGEHERERQLFLISFSFAMERFGLEQRVHTFSHPFRRLILIENELSERAEKQCYIFLSTPHSMLFLYYTEKRESFFARRGLVARDCQPLRREVQIIHYRETQYHQHTSEFLIRIYYFLRKRKQNCSRK